VLSALVPLAAIGTIADVMPLVGENRAIVRTGIGLIRDSGIEGLDALLRVGDVAKDGIDSETIAFRLAPRMNACGRLGSAEAAVRLLTTARGDECVAIRARARRAQPRAAPHRARRIRHRRAPGAGARHGWR
jgi:single-stranded-DNA-specific exonuclease